jgi:uncharacterized protein (UPF0548 family)
MTWQLYPFTTQQLTAFSAAQSGLPLSYGEEGATRGEFPVGFTHDRNEAIIGHGMEEYERAVQGLRAWKMFPSGWTTVVPNHMPPTLGSTVVVIFRLLGIYWRSAARIVYEVDERDVGDVVQRQGFAYGTLPGHVECGEEAFTIALRKDGAVVYELRAFSRPQYLLTRLAKPLARRWQRRFVRESQIEMRRYVSGAA